MRRCLKKFTTTIIILSTLALFTATPGFAEPRLLYPQEQALKGITNKLGPIIKDFKIYNALHTKGDYSRDPTPELFEMLSKINTLEREFAAQNFPVEIKKIKNIKTWFASLKKNTPILEEVYLEGYDKQLQELKKSDLSNFPDYDEDVERLKKIYKAYKNPRSTFQNPEKAGPIVAAFQDEYAFFKHLPQKYELPLKAKKARSLQTMLDTNAKYMDKFKTYQDDHLLQLPDKIRCELGQATAVAAKAEAEKKPLFFKGGVAHHLEKANALLALLTTAKGEDAPEVTAMNQEYATDKQKIDAAEKSMAAELLAAVEMPADNYNGGDRNKLKEMIKKEWEKLYPADEIMAIQLPAADWSRNVKWKWNNSDWYKVDTSVLTSRVIVKSDDQIATIFCAFINKDHLENDSLNVGAHTKKAGYVTHNMLLKNVTQ